MSYRLTMISYCGMTRDLIEEGTLEECQDRARKFRKHHEHEGGCVSELEAGMKWELETPEDALLIGDDDGFLTIQLTSEEVEVEEEEVCIG